MTDNAKKIFNFLKENRGQKMTQKDIATALDVPNASVTGTVTGLCKKDLAVRESVESTDGEGKKVVVKYIYLTDAGYDYDPEDSAAE